MVNNMEKRFSTIKFIQSMDAHGLFATEKNRAITRNVCPWWIKCDGLTEEEMKNLGYCTCDDWME